jgi:nitrate/nitrite transport system ATP-binding protein
VQEDLGYVIATDLDIWNGHPEKVLGVREEWANKYPGTHLALVKALLEACEYCDDRRHRQEILDYLCQSQYLNISPEYLRPGFIDPYSTSKDSEPEMLLDFNQFYVKQSNYPSRGEGLWILTQLARWGYIDFPKNWVEIIERVRRPDLFGEACRHLGWPDLEGDHHNISLFDGMVFTPNDPVGYIKRFTIHRDVKVSEILIDQIDEVNK